MIRVGNRKERSKTECKAHIWVLAGWDCLLPSLERELFRDLGDQNPSLTESVIVGTHCLRGASVESVFLSFLLNSRSVMSSKRTEPLPKAHFRPLPRMKERVLFRNKQVWLFSLQVLLLVTLLRLNSRRYRQKQISTYYILKNSQHFANSFSPYTSLTLADRRISSEGFLNHSSFHGFEGIIFKHFIRNYMLFHNKHRRTANRYLVFTPSGGGLGDRFQGMLYAYWAAVASKRVFLIKWNDPFPVQDFVKEADDNSDIFYDSTSDKPRQARLRNGSTIPEIAYLTNKKTTPEHFERILASNVHTVEMKTSRYPTQFSGIFIDSHKPKELPRSEMRNVLSTFNFKRAVLHHVLQLSDEMREHHERVSRAMGLRSDESSPHDNQRRPYIGIHARLGKGVREDAGRFQNISKHFEAAARCLASRGVRLSILSGSPPLPVFLATDTEEFKGIFEKEVREMSHGRVKVVSGNWGAVHTKDIQIAVDRQKKEEEGGGQPSDSNLDAARRSLWDSYTDLVMLGHAEHILSLYSSFPRLALALGDAESLIEVRNEICLEKENWKVRI